jgi:DNA-binding beta-propeller fold protein YncE
MSARSAAAGAKAIVIGYGRRLGAAPAAQHGRAEMMKDDAPPPQISFTLGNPNAQNTIYISADKSKNNLTLQLTQNAAVAVTPATPLVPKSQAGSATGSLFYLELGALGIDKSDFANFALNLTGWQSQPYPDDGMICFSPTTATSLDPSKPVSFTLSGFVLPTAPSTPAVALKLDIYHAPPVARGSFPAVTSTQVSVTPPPSAKDDLHKALKAEILPQAVVVSIANLPEIHNRLTLTLSQVGGGPTALAGPETVFTLTVVYASDENGYGALMTTDAGKNISIPVPQGGGWTPTNIDGLGGRSWQLVPDNGATLPSTGGNPVSFDFSPIVTYFQPGPTVLLLNYTGVPGYQDSAFAITLIKEPHVRIDSFDAAPTLTPLEDQRAKVKLTWSVANAGTLILDPMHKNVTGLTSFDATIEDTTTFTLTAYGPDSGNVDNIAIKNATTTVFPVLNSFDSAPSAVSVDDFKGGSASVALRWAVNAPDKAQLQLWSSVTGAFAPHFAPIATTTLDIKLPQMFTLNVIGDTRPQDTWRLYVPAFTLQNKEPAGCQGAYAAAAPGASYIAASQAGANQIAIYSSASYNKIASVSCGTTPQGLVFSPDGSTIYVANQGDGTIGVITVTTASQQTPPWIFSKGTSISVGGAPAKVALAPSDYLYATVANGANAGTLAMVTLADGTVNQVTVGKDPYGLAVTPSGAQVFVANRADGTVAQIGISPRGIPQLIRTLTGLPGAAGLAVTPDGNTLLVACSDGTVQLLDATAPDTSPVTPIQVGGRPMDIALDPSGAYAFVTDNAGAKVALINIAKQAVLGTPVSVAASPLGVSVSPDGMLVFAGHAAALSVLSLQTYVLRSNPPNCGGYVTSVAVSADGSSAFVWADATYKIKNLTPASGLHVYDVPSETLVPALPGTPIIDLAVAPGAANIAFLTQRGQSAIYPFDTGQQTLGNPLAIPAKGGFANRQPLKVAAPGDGSRVFVLVSDGSTFQFSIVVFTNGSNGYQLTDDVTVYTTIGNPIDPKLAAAPDGTAAYTYDALQGNLWSITATSGRFAAGSPLLLGVSGTAGILPSPDGSKLYIAGQVQFTTTFFLVDSAAWTFQPFTLSEPAYQLSIQSMALSPDGTRILISDPTGGQIRFIDAQSIRFLQTIVDPGSFKAPQGVAMTPDQSRLFVADQSGLFGTAIQIRPAASQQ